MRRGSLFDSEGKKLVLRPVTKKTPTIGKITILATVMAWESNEGIKSANDEETCRECKVREEKVFDARESLRWEVLKKVWELRF